LNLGSTKVAILESVTGKNMGLTPVKHSFGIQDFSTASSDEVCEFINIFSAVILE
jgi:hypothetical protein